MYLLEVLVKLPLHGSHCCFRISGQPGSANRKVFVATGALAVHPRFIVLGDLKVWLFHVIKFPTVKIPVTSPVDFKLNYYYYGAP